MQRSSGMYFHLIPISFIVRVDKRGMGIIVLTKI